MERDPPGRQYAASRVYDRLFALHGWTEAQQVIREAAQELGRARPNAFDFERFANDLDTPATNRLLEEDVREARFRGERWVLTGAR